MIQQLNLFKIYFNYLLSKKNVFYIIILKKLQIKKNLRGFISFFKLFIDLNNYGKYKTKNLSDIKKR